MVSIKERVRPTSFLNESDSEMVLKFIAEEKYVGLEMIIERFPWIRWGDMFSILGKLRRDGAVTVHQVHTILEVRIHKNIHEMS